jgi:uncharacterized membrane protein
MNLHLTPTGSIHATLALFCIVVGAVQLIRPKRGASHRARGYAYVYAILVADGAAMLLYRFTGAFKIFHVGALVNLVFVIVAIAPVLRTPRPANWKLWHYNFIAWSYVDLIAAALTEVAVRLSYPITHASAWLVTAIVSALVTAIGYVLIQRYRPPPDSRSAIDAATIQPDGAPS